MKITVESRESKAESRKFALPSTLDPRPSTARSGIALVITLILLSVTLIMAVAFLAISNRERNAVTTTTDAATAKLAADSALAHAEAQITANVFATTNPYNFGLLVSTNYISGFISGISSPTNVNYVDTNGFPLGAADNLLNLANLLYNPRPPVFVPNPTNSALPSDFRFYLDLNRNGRFEPNGLLPVISPDPANPFYHLNGNTMPNIVPGDTRSNLVVGDPEWIGQLARPDLPHGPNNFFVARYAFFAAPIGNTLDLNYIHDQTITRTVNPSSSGIVSDGYFRNQGVGTWEINLAAFLADLNTNQWDPQGFGNDYRYQQATLGIPNSGAAFDDARALLSYRYNFAYNSLSPSSVLFGNNAGVSAVFANDNIDGYSDGTLMTNTFLSGDFVGNDDPTKPWAGADNTNHFFTSQELFDPNKSSANFVNRLAGVGTNSTYDRYTFYRLQSQLGTDSEPERGKINLNYINVDASGDIVPNMETNLFAWTPVQFFTSAADRLLRVYTTNWFKANPSNYLATYYGIHIPEYYYVDASGFTHTNDPTALGLTNIPFFGMTNQMPAFGLANIPVLINSNFVYSSSANRLLQLAANAFDATTNRFISFGMDYPSVFRPTFWVTNQLGNKNVFINGFEFVSPIVGQTLTAGTAPLDTPIDVTALPIGITAGINNLRGNVYGVPWILGAKKGFPNFNEFSMNTVVQITRKLEIARTNISTSPVLTQTNQMYVFRIENTLGVEFWNSYTNQYPNQVQVVVQDTNSMAIVSTNGTTTFYSANYSGPTPSSTNVPTWQGTTWLYGGGLNLDPFNDGSQPFVIPLNTNVLVLTNAIYRFSTASFIPEGNGLGWENTDPPTPPLPQMLLLMTNRLQAFMLDGQHVIDYVQFNGPDRNVNLNSQVQTNGTGASYVNTFSVALDNNNNPWGILSQIGVSEGVDYGNSQYWKDSNSRKSDEILGFRNFMGPPLPILPAGFPSQYNSLSISNFYATNTIVQVPFTPTITISDYTSWQANDPLVHYLASDLNFSGTEQPSGLTTGLQVLKLNETNLTTGLPDLGDKNERYKPWYFGNDEDQKAGNKIEYKDPLVSQSDFWDFPAGKFPTIGWLGRVHRGTPWQTVYLKSSDVLKQIQVAGEVTNYIGTNVWIGWTGNLNTNDAVNTSPTQDRLLFDVFTTALNDNAPRGQLSVNVGANVNDPAAGLAAWSALFSGIIVLSNNVDDFTATLARLTAQPVAVTNLIIDPAGLAGLNSTLGQLVKNIYDTRTNFVNADGLKGVFEHRGDILATPLLAAQSPFLNWDNPAQQQYGISDELYEWLPQQMMSLLRCPTAPRYVVYCYGQTLKPAQNSLVTGGQFFGMCTNYQIVSEAVVRAVLRVDDANTSHPHAVVESYNILPPD